MNLVNHVRSYDSNPLRDDFEFDDGNFYSRTQPRELNLTHPIKWYVYQLEGEKEVLKPVSQCSLQLELERSYQTWRESLPTYQQLTKCRKQSLNNNSNNFWGFFKRFL